MLSEKTVINTLTQTCVQLTCVPLILPERKSSTVVFRSDPQVPPWESMCYTSPLFAKTLLLPRFQSHLLTDGTAR